MRKRRRDPKEIKELAPKLVKYYFDNPENNGYKTMKAKFNVHEDTIRRILSNELDNRFKKRHSNKCIKELED